MNNETKKLTLEERNAAIEEITGLDLSYDHSKQRENDTSELDNFLNWLIEKDSELSVSFDNTMARVMKWDNPAGLIFDAKLIETLNENSEPIELKSKAAACNTVWVHSFEELEEIFKDFVQVGIFALRECKGDELLRGNYMVRFAGVLSETWDMEEHSKEEMNVTREYFKRLENKDE